jgi:hypothetical protein
VGEVRVDEDIEYIPLDAPAQRAERAVHVEHRGFHG